MWSKCLGSIDDPPPPPPPPEDSRVYATVTLQTGSCTKSTVWTNMCNLCTYWKTRYILARTCFFSWWVYNLKGLMVLFNHSMAFPYSCSVNQGTSIQLQPNLHSIFFFLLVLCDKIHRLPNSLTVAALIWHLGGWVCYEVWEIGSACSPEMDLELGQIAVYFLFWGLEWALKMNLKEL